MRLALLLLPVLLSLGCVRPTTPTHTPTDAAPPQAGAECRTAEDCTLTAVPEGGCCPLLCRARAVTVAEGRRLEERQRQCEAQGGPCPVPSCARPRTRPVPVCTAGRCSTEDAPMEQP